MQNVDSLFVCLFVCLFVFLFVFYCTGFTLVASITRFQSISRIKPRLKNSGITTFCVILTFSLTFFYITIYNVISYYATIYDINIICDMLQ